MWETEKKTVGDQWNKILLFFQLLLFFDPSGVSSSLAKSEEKICSSAVLLHVSADARSWVIKEVSGEETALSGLGGASQLCARAV